MSYFHGAGLQAKLFERLVGDATLAALVGTAIHDAPLEPGPEGPAREFVTLGEESVRANDTKTSAGAIHDFTVTVHSGRNGFETAKRIAAAVCASLVDAPLLLDAGRLVALRFLRAGAERGPGPEKRRISLRFRAVVDAAD
jgi:hypothetical protein